MAILKHESVNRVLNFKLLLAIINVCFPGLVRSLNVATSHTTSPVLTFISAKCEVNVHWLQPLLTRLSKHPNTLVSPSLDRIDPNTGQYVAAANNIRGGK